MHAPKISTLDIACFSFDLLCLSLVCQCTAGRVLFQRHLRLEHSMENMQFCKEVDRFKTLPDSKLEKESRTIAAKYVGEGTPKQVSTS